MKPLVHARISAKRYGGKPEDYLPIHDLIDWSKSCMADMRHRAIMHNTFGCYVAERVFGTSLTNSDGKKVSVRDVAEDHIREDLGFIPTIERWLQHMPIEPWMTGSHKRFKPPEKLLDAPLPESHTEDNIFPNDRTFD